MTVLYWVAAAAALVSATQAAWELTRDRSSALAAWVLSMTALSATLALAATVPAVLQGRPGPAAWACAGFGTLGTWGFAEVLATTSGDGRRVTDIMTIPLLAGASVALLLLGLNWAGSRGSQNAALVAIGVPLTLVIYYAPALAKIVTLAQQRASAAPASWARVAMRAVCASAAAEIVFTLARSAVMAAGASGTHAGTSLITVVGVLQAIAAVYGIGALAAGPVVMLISARGERWRGAGTRRGGGRHARQRGEPSRRPACAGASISQVEPGIPSDDLDAEVTGLALATQAKRRCRHREQAAKPVPRQDR